MAVKLWSNRIEQFCDSTGVPRSGAKLFTYVGGSVNTKQTTYTESTGTTPNTNPIVLDSSGRIPQPIWLTTGVSYKFVLAPSTDTDPPTSPIDTLDVITGINDSSSAQNEWVAGPAPTFVSATSFTLVGDQTANFSVGRRLKTTNTSGTIYSTITASAFAAATTVTVVNDSGVLDSGLSAVFYGLLAATNTSEPLIIDTYPVRSGSVDKTKKVRLEVDGLTTATTRVLTVQDSDDTIVGRATTDSLTNKTITGTTNIVGSGVQAAEQASTSGTSIDFTGIPSWVKKVIVQFIGVSTNGVDNPRIQIGTSGGGIEVSGYLGANTATSASAVSTANFTAGFDVHRSASAAAVFHGQAILTLERASTFAWVCTGSVGLSNTTELYAFAGSKLLSGILDRVRITTSGGVNTFDAGVISILYE